MSLLWMIASAGLWSFKRSSRELALLLAVSTVIIDFLMYWFIGFQVFTAWTYVWLISSAVLFLVIRSKSARPLFGLPPRGGSGKLLKVGGILMVLGLLTVAVGSFLYIRIKFYNDDWNKLLEYSRSSRVKIERKECAGDCELIYFCNISFKSPTTMELYNLVVGEDGCRIGFSTELTRLVAMDNYDYLSPLAISLKYKSPYALERNVRFAKFRPLYLLFRRVNMLYDSTHSDFMKFGKWKGFITYVKSKGVEIKLYDGPPWRTVDVFLASDDGRDFSKIQKDWFSTFGFDGILWTAERYYDEGKKLQGKGKLPKAAIYLAQAYYVDPSNPEYAYEYLKIKKDLGIWTFGYELEKAKREFSDDERFDIFFTEDVPK